jgi:hypothetical protein
MPDQSLGEPSALLPDTVFHHGEKEYDVEE